MSETQKLKEAQRLISINNIEKATPLLWQLYSSNNPNIKLNAILSLLVVLDYVTGTEKILQIIEEGIKIATSMGKNDVVAFLLGRKSFFLESVLGFLIYRQKNLVLSANVFKWINFATVVTSLNINKVERLSKKTKRSFEGRAITACSMAMDTSLKFSGDPMYRHLSVFCSSPPTVLVTASMNMTMSASMFSFLNIAIMLLKGLFRVTYTPGMFLSSMRW